MTTIEQGWVAFTEEEYALAEHLFERSLVDALDEETSRQAQFGLGYVLAFTNRFAEARKMFEQLQHDARSRGALSEEHRALHQVGMVERMSGRWVEAQRVFAREARLIECLGNPPLPVAVNAYEQGIVALHLADFEQAHHWLTLSLQEATNSGDLVAIACAHRGLGDYFAQLGEADKATESWNLSASAFAQGGEVKAVTEVQARIANLLTASPSE